MASANNSKSYARLEARVSPEVKALWQKAADLAGVTLTDFVIASVQQAAYQAIAQHQMLKLNLDDSEAFVDAILNSPPPNEALKQAASRYKQTMQS